MTQQVPAKVGRRNFLKYVAGGVAVVAVAGAAGWYFLTPQKAKQQGTITIGYYGPLSGNYAIVGVQELNGLTMAVEEINANGGVLGRQLAIVARDTTADGPTALAKTRELISDGAVVVYGGISDAEGLAVAPYANQQKTCQIGQIGSDDTTGKTCQWYTFSAYIRNSAMVRASLAGLFQKQVVPTDTFIAAPDYVWGHQMHDAFQSFAPQYSTNVMGSVFIPFAAADMSPYIQKAQASGAKTIYCIEYGSDLVNFINQFARANTGQTLVTSVATYDAYSTIPAQALANTYMAIPFWSQVPNDAVNQAFTQKVQNKLGITPSYNNEIGYNTGYNVAAAIEQANSTVPTDFVAKLEGMQFTRTRSKTQQYRACDHGILHDMYVVQGKTNPANADDWNLITTSFAGDIISPCGATVGGVVSACNFPNKP